MFNKFIKEIYNDSGLKNDGFIHKDKQILRAPIGDFVEGYSFDKSDNHFFVTLFIQPSYFPSSHIVYTYGWRLKKADKMGDMFFLDDNLSYSKSEVVRLITESKNVVLSINSPMDFYNRFQNPHDLYKFGFDQYLHSEKMAMTLCYAHRPEALSAVDDAIVYWDTSTRKHLIWMQDIRRRLLELKSVFGNPQESAQLFKKWRSYTIENLHLQKYSFPVVE